MKPSPSPLIALCFCAAALCCAPTGASQPSSPYAPWPNGPPAKPSFFPIAVWWQSPTATGHSGPHPTLAAAAAAAGINIFHGLSGPSGAPDSWPERFGRDEGELEAIKANQLYVIGGINTPSDQNTSAASVASMLALAKAIGAERNLIGYNAGDEPSCDGQMQAVPAVVAAIGRFDPSRVVLYNHTAWMKSPQWSQCLPASIAALRATSIGSFDLYPLTDPWLSFSPGYGGSDFESVPNDGLFLQGLTTRALVHFGRPDQPMWAVVGAGGDNFGFSEANNTFKGAVAAGSDVLVNESGWSRFTSAWVGLVVSGAGLAPKTQIVGVVDPTHAKLSAPASASADKADVTVTGGAFDSDCVERVNLCIVNGNEYRPTPAQVNAEVWISLINGARGIGYFCHDRASYSFCLGDAAGGPAAAVAAANLAYVNATILKFAPALNAPTAASCSMQQQNFDSGEAWTTESCHDGVLSMATDNRAVPGMAMVKQLGDVIYLFAQSDRRSEAGARFTFTLSGMASKTATLVYDSNDRYDPAHSAQGFKAALDADGRFSDTLGAHHADYQVKIYAIR
ncbi:MAG: hypothetical protein JO127_15705 [Caulobacteraceae bacterium]|nr:hypothetical protein [Caulobacteraceae bacterium]